MSDRTSRRPDTAVVSDDLAQKFKTEKDTPYLRFVRGEGLDIIGAHYVRNLRTVELKPWARRGGCGAFLNHDASRTTNDCYVCEIAPAGKLNAQRQLFELMWPDGQGDPIRYDWEVGSLIVPPNAVYHQHFNTGATPGRYLAFKHGGSPRNSQGVLLCFISKRVGGDQLDYADEDPATQKMFADELARHGLAPRMDESYRQERETLPPIGT